MNTRFSGWQIGVLATLFLCVCCELTGIGIFVAYSLGNDSSQIAEVDPFPTATRPSTAPPAFIATNRATALPTFTPTPARTYTRVIEPNQNANLPPLAIPIRTPTSVADPYKVVVPTPTAPVTMYPITFTSTLKVITYNVTGKSVNDISKSLEANALADPHEPGSRYYALTRWQLGSNWTYQPSARGCQVTRGDVTVMITMTLPALASTGVSVDVQKRFDAFIEKGILHESGHAERALQGARDFQRNLGNFAPAADCELLRTQLNNLFRRSFDAIDSANTDYDAKTLHGLTQGAVFP